MRYAHHILSLFNIVSCNWNALGSAFFHRWYSCRRIVVPGLPASHLPCNTNTNGEYGGWRSSSKPEFWMTASAWADLWSDALSWLQTERIHEETPNFLTTRTLSARYMAGWKTKNNNSSTTGSELWRNAGPSAFQSQVSMLKSDKIWCAYLILNCISLRTFWMPLVMRHGAWVVWDGGYERITYWRRG